MSAEAGSYEYEIQLAQMIACGSITVSAAIATGTTYLNSQWTDRVHILPLTVDTAGACNIAVRGVK